MSTQNKIIGGVVFVALTAGLCFFWGETAYDWFVKRNKEKPQASGAASVDVEPESKPKANQKPAYARLVDLWFSDPNCSSRKSFILKNFSAPMIDLGKFYERTLDCSAQPTNVRFEGCNDVQQQGAGYCTVYHTGAGSGRKQEQQIELRMVNGEWFVDWLGTTGYNPASLAFYLSRDFENTVRFRVFVTIGSIYSSAYDRSKWQAIEIAEGRKSETAYMPRELPRERELLTLLGDGKQHRAHIALKRRILKKEIRNGEYLPVFNQAPEVTEIVALHWRELEHENQTPNEPTDAGVKK